jgi:hypothetical protein
VNDIEIIIARLRKLRLAIARVIETFRPPAPPSHWRY